MTARLLSSLALTLLVPTVFGTPIAPFPGGDFTEPTLWQLSGYAWVEDGVAKLGQFESDCTGPEAAGVVGSITSTAPVVVREPTRLEFDYLLVMTKDILRFSGLQLQLVDAADGRVTPLATFNPNTVYGFCRELKGHAALPLAPAPPQVGFLRFAVYEDAFGDPFYIEFDNVTLGA